MFTLQHVTYTHPDKDVLFDDLNLVINKHDKISLTGNNGAGKSTLLKLLAGILQPSGGTVSAAVKPYYVPQVFGQFNALTVAQALQVDHKLAALKQILEGNVTDENMALLNDDWTIEERCREAIAHWKLDDISLEQQMESLSGGQKTRVFLAGLLVHRPEVVLLDEPSNHLDIRSRKILYGYIVSTRNTLVVVSHDRTLLNLLSKVYELDKGGITVYGGNYDFYTEQKKAGNEALALDIKTKEKLLRKAKETEKESLARQQKLDVRGRKKQDKAGIPTIMLNTLKNKAEKSTSKMKHVHAEKVGGLHQQLDQLRKELPVTDKMKVSLDPSALHKGKILVSAIGVNYEVHNCPLWQQGLTFEIRSGERWTISGPNGSGKTTLLKMILGRLQPMAGQLERANFKSIYVDQDYSLIDNTLTVYQQAESYNTGTHQEHEIKARLNRFLFTADFWDKPCKTLSGGEKMRLMLCSLTISSQAPDLIILDEPTNNLDLQNIEILTTAINEYQGTLIVVSHDEYFLEGVGVRRRIRLS